MKIAICSTGNNLDAQVSPVFGRCPYFLIIDGKTKKGKVVENSAFVAGRGAGVGAAQTVASEKVEAVICGNFGPNAFAVLKMSGVKPYTAAANLTIKEAVEQYKKGQLNEVKLPTGAGFGFGRGGGRGFGRGLGRGRRRW